MVWAWISVAAAVGLVGCDIYLSRQERRRK
jgi:hypothetical protein